nr:cancer susceptibility candidate protein 1 [Hymenolepis microstoma]
MEDVMIDSLIDELRSLIADLNEDHSELERYHGVMQELRELVQEKVNGACVETLTRASHFADPVTGNLQKYWHNDWLSLCIWANLSKNPRIKEYTFENVGITFSISQSLTHTDCAFRILFMKFDTYSVLSPSYKPQQIGDYDLERISSSPADHHPTSKLFKKYEQNIDVIENMDKNLFIQREMKTSLNLFSVFSEDQEDKEETEDIIEEPEEDRATTPPKPHWEPLNLPDDAIDLCDYHVVGGVFQFDLLKLPRQPRTGRGWNWTNCVVPPILTPLEYTVGTPRIESDAMEGTPDNSVKEESGKEENQKTKVGDQVDMDRNAIWNIIDIDKNSGNEQEPNPPVEVKLRLPKCLIIPEEPVLACWDAETQMWRTRGIVIKHFRPELNEISFFTEVFGTFAVFQDFHLNMPFQHWEMRPLPRKICRDKHAEDDVVDPSHTVEQQEKPPAGPLANQVMSETTIMTELTQKSQSQNDEGSDAQQPAKSTKLLTMPSLSTQKHSDAHLSVNLETGKAIDSKPQQLPGSSSPQLTALGPLESMGIPDAEFLSDKTEADQCLITITGAYIKVKLHVMDDRIAILTEDPRAILDPTKTTEDDTPRQQTGMSTAGKSTSVIETEEDEGGKGSTPRRFTAKQSRIFERHGLPSPSANGDEGALELQHVAGRWFTHDELIEVLRASGVNLFPRLDSCTRVECNEKNELTEQRLYEQMALLSTVMAFSWSHWNAACHDANRIILLATEHQDNDSPVDEERLKVYSMDRKFVYQLKMAESDDKFSEEPEPSLHKHADFYHMYLEIGSERGRKRVEETESRYFKTVQRILKAMRLPVFS